MDLEKLLGLLSAFNELVTYCCSWGGWCLQWASGPWSMKSSAICLNSCTVCLLIYQEYLWKECIFFECRSLKTVSCLYHLYGPVFSFQPVCLFVFLVSVSIKYIFIRKEWYFLGDWKDGWSRLCCCRVRFWNESCVSWVLEYWIIFQHLCLKSFMLV